jgi:hypothetical protein
MNPLVKVYQPCQWLVELFALNVLDLPVGVRVCLDAGEDYDNKEDSQRPVKFDDVPVS